VILAVVFGVILFTLVAQGLSLPRVIAWLRLEPDDDAEGESLARRHAAAVALERLEALEREDWTHAEAIERLRGLYGYREARFASQLRPDDDGGYEDRNMSWMRMQCALIHAQRDEVERLRRAGEVTDEVARRVVRDLDLEEARLRS
jgi:CPA1 family monovalent cation:H+ antiporter